LNDSLESNLIKKNLRGIEDNKMVKLTDMGHLKEVMYMETVPFGTFNDIVKLNKDMYMILSTGEIKAYNHTENRSQNVDKLRITFKKIRQIINYNFIGADNELAFTLTYADNMTDPKILYDDFRKFFQRLRYKHGKDIDYFSVVEPQGRGAWHCHVLLRFNTLSKIYIPNSEIADMWGQGFVTVKAIRKDVDNLGAYLSAYLGDVEIDRNLDLSSVSGNYEIKTIEVDGVEKRFLKGARLCLYPTGMNIYRKSRGIKDPESIMIPYGDIKKIVGTTTPNYSSDTLIVDDNNTIVNRIIHQQYNLKRLKSQ